MGFDEKVNSLLEKMASESGLVFQSENLGQVANDEDQYVVTILTRNNIRVTHFTLQTVGGKVAYFFDIDQECPMERDLEEWLIRKVGYLTKDAVTVTKETSNSVEYILED